MSGRNLEHLFSGPNGNVLGTRPLREAFEEYRVFNPRIDLLKVKDIGSKLRAISIDSKYIGFEEALQLREIK